MLKSNWEETKRHFTAWWERRGMVVGMWGAPWQAGVNHADAPPPPATPREAYTDVGLRARRSDWELRRQCFPADVMPIACTNTGPGSLTFYLGCEPGFSPETVWFEVYDRIYDIIRDDDGSSAFHSFYVWGPGKTAKLQCDGSAMVSPDMFQQFVVPSLTAQCEWLDHSMYHLDGTQAMCHLDALLAIEALDAIEWTPQAGLERSAHPRWHELYRRILAAGKSVQVCGVSQDEILPVLDAIGGKGVYFITTVTGERDAEELPRTVEPYR